MADTPTPNAMLADELDAWAVSIGSVYPDQQKLLWRAAAALRAPTPNATLADDLEALFAEYGQANSDYGCAIERYERDRDAKTCREIKAAFLEKAAALRAPTIAADDALLSARAKILAWVGHVAFEQPDYSTMEEEVTRLAREILALATPTERKRHSRQRRRD